MNTGRAPAAAPAPAGDDTTLPACRRIVAACDLSEGSVAAVRLAAGWAAELGVALRVLHAAPRRVATATAVRELRAALVDLLAGALADARGGVHAAGSSADTDVRVVPGPPRTVLRAAATTPGTWLVAGSEGHSATVQRRAGVVAGSLARACPAPVLFAPPAGAHRPATARGVSLGLRGRLLVGVGLSGGEGDARLVRAAARLALPAGHLALAHSVDVSRFRRHPAPLREAELARAGERAAARTRRLRTLGGDLVPLDLVARDAWAVHVMVQGPVEQDLAGLAVSQAADLVVVGSGPRAARLLAHSPCPVLVLPPRT